MGWGTNDFISERSETVPWTELLTIHKQDVHLFCGPAVHYFCLIFFYLRLCNENYIRHISASHIVAYFLVRPNLSMMDLCHFEPVTARRGMEIFFGLVNLDVRKAQTYPWKFMIINPI